MAVSTGEARVPRQACRLGRAALAAALWLGAAAACGGGGGDKAAGPGDVSYDLLYVDDAPLPAMIASGFGFDEELVGGKLLLSGGTATVVQSRTVSTSAGTTAPSDTTRYAYQRSGDKLVLKDPTDGTVVGTVLVDSGVSPDLYLHWSATIVGQRGSRAGTLTYMKHS
jgi:hypothetical protein